MRFMIVMLLGAILAEEALAQGYPTMDIGVDCKLRWQPPTEGSPVQGYKVHIEKQNPVLPVVETDVGNVLEYSCEAAGVGEGSWHFWVTAYNQGGNGLPSTILPFTYYELIRIDVGPPINP